MGAHFLPGARVEREAHFRYDARADWLRFL
jgi:hypothetical protein